MEIQKGNEIMSIEQIAVVILNYLTWEDTLKEAEHIHDFLGFAWEQIIIVDNASTNESKEKLEKKQLGNYTFIETGQNNGYASGNNVGLKYAYEKGFRYGWVINNDIIIEQADLCERLLYVFEQDESIASVNPDIYAPDGYLYNRDALRPNFYDLTIGYYTYKKRGRALKDFGKYGYVYRPQGCCMMLDLEKLHEIDYMDEHTFLYCEEFILAEKFLKKGWKCACTPEGKVIHNHSKTVKTVLGKWKTISVQNKSFKYYLKRYREYNWLKRSVCILFYSLKNFITN